MEDLKIALQEILSRGGDPLQGLEIQFRSVAGPSFGFQREYESRLRASGDGKALLFRRRDGGDSATETPGWFEGQIPSDQLQRFLSELEKDPFAEAGSAAASPGDAELSLEVLLDHRVYTWTWTSALLEGSDRLDGLMGLLYGWGGNLCTKPRASLELEFKVGSTGSRRLAGTLSMLNRGSAEISFLHPGSPLSLGPTGLVLLHGEAPIRQEGVTPLPFEPDRTVVSGISLDRPIVLRIPAGETWSMELDTDLSEILPGSWMGQIGLYTYGGTDVLAGVDLFGGAVFSREFGS